MSQGYTINRIVVQGIVSDVPPTLPVDTVQSLSLTQDGRLRVSSAPTLMDQVWQGTFNSPWYSDSPFFKSTGVLYV